MVSKIATSVRRYSPAQPATKVQASNPLALVRWQFVVASGIARADTARQCSWVCRTDTAHASSVPRPHCLPKTVPTISKIATLQSSPPLNDLVNSIKPKLKSVEETVSFVVRQVRLSNHLSLDDVKRLASAAEVLANVLQQLDAEPAGSDQKAMRSSFIQPKSTGLPRAVSPDTPEEIPGAELVSEIIKHWKVVQSKLAHLDRTIAAIK